ncbi:hypothetical protein HMN09_00996000 [Mycena chlorophos]|uniref:Uncharacterized protein n=1 Tax=Mycena chlorophos TaxID=658473 RepID=A0A8H6SJA7_MYCCL|nr:hypothetical protein HMN09_00996000 [Mycena chlorophos]
MHPRLTTQLQREFSGFIAYNTRIIDFEVPDGWEPLLRRFCTEFNEIWTEPTERGSYVELRAVRADSERLKIAIKLGHPYAVDSETFPSLTGMYGMHNARYDAQEESTRVCARCGAESDARLTLPPRYSQWHTALCRECLDMCRVNGPQDSDEAPFRWPAEAELA